MKEVGQVIELKGNLVAVEIKDGLLDEGDCSSCSSSSACGSFLSLDADGKAVKAVSLPNSINARVGDFVVLELKESSSILLSILVYLFPILMMLLGYFVGEYIGYGMERVGKLEDNLLAIVFSFIFLFIGLCIVYLLDKFLSKKARFNPYLKSFYTGTK